MRMPLRIGYIAAWVGIVGSCLVCGVSCKKETKPSPTSTRPAGFSQSATAPEIEPNLVQAPQAIKTESGVDMVVIPGGSFLMGDEQGEDTQPPHKVTISSFWMEKYEVTQEQYEDLIGNNPAKFCGAKLPVEQVRWTQAARYCNARSQKENLKPCYDEKTWGCDFDASGYRLPTEAEWEYACRAGTTTAYSFGNDSRIMDSYACYKGNSGRKTHVGNEKKPNPWGLHNMHGNVTEWCNDWYEPKYNAVSSEKDPRGPVSGTKRVLRGGSWSNPPEKCTSSYRYKDSPVLSDVCLGYDIYGFRCVRKLPGGDATLQQKQNRTPML